MLIHLAQQQKENFDAITSKFFILLARIASLLFFQKMHFRYLQCNILRNMINTVNTDDTVGTTTETY